MKRIIIVLEALDYNYLLEVNPPNVMSLEDVHPAVSFALGSRPATGALLGGMLPICQIPMCYHRDVQGAWSNSFLLTTMKKITEKQFFLCSNGWSLELMLPWIESKEERAMNFKWVFEDKAPAREMVDYFLREKEKYKSYFAYIHLMETHYPFNSPYRLKLEEEDERRKKEEKKPIINMEDKEQVRRFREEALLYVDGMVGEILEACKDAQIVLCSDHNLPPNIVSAASDVPAPKTMLSFIATTFKEAEWWDRVLGIDVHKLAREYWLK